MNTAVKHSSTAVAYAGQRCEARSMGGPGEGAQRCTFSRNPATWPDTLTPRETSGTTPRRAPWSPDRYLPRGIAAQLRL